MTYATRRLKMKKLRNGLGNIVSGTPCIRLKKVRTLLIRSLKSTHMAEIDLHTQQHFFKAGRSLGDLISLWFTHFDLNTHEIVTTWRSLFPSFFAI